MAENRLNFFVGDSERVKIGRKSAAKRVPVSPHRKILVLLEQMAVSLALFLRFFADAAPLDRRLNHAPREIVEIQRFFRPPLEDETDRELSHSLVMRVERDG